MEILRGQAKFSIALFIYLAMILSCRCVVGYLH